MIPIILFRHHWSSDDDFADLSEWEFTDFGTPSRPTQPCTFHVSTRIVRSLNSQPFFT